MFTLKKQEKICSKKLTESLYLHGQSFISYPFRVSYLIHELNTNFPAQVLFIVSKKRYKRAHDRNRIRRLMREAYRLTKSEFYKFLIDNKKTVIISINYIAQEELSFQIIKANMEPALRKILSKPEFKIAAV